MKITVNLNELNKDSGPIAGGKGANLGEMISSGFLVPPGFVVTAQAYALFLEESEIKERIFSLLKKVDVDNSDNLIKVSEEIQKIILDSVVPYEIDSSIRAAYKNIDVKPELMRLSNNRMMDFLHSSRESVFVAVRSSATAEDLPGASFAGQMQTFLNVKGEVDVVKNVKKCWASLFTPRAIFYRQKNNFPHEKVQIAVIVQKMVNSEKAGVMFSINPASNNKEEIVIEGAWGLGESVVSGYVTPDEYIVDKASFKIKSKRIAVQKEMIEKNEFTGENETAKVHELKQGVQKLTDPEIDYLARLSKELEDHYGCPQDSEWAIEKNKIFLVQTRPVTTLKKNYEAVKMSGKILLSGIGAGANTGCGPVKKIESEKGMSDFKQGDVLVAKMTTPDYVPIMKKAVGIITDEGGQTCHAAIVARELGIPCVVGTGNAMSTLKNGQMVTVDASHGNVYEGKVIITKEDDSKNLKIKTKTKIKLILDFPEIAEELAKDFDGIGLLRVEHMLISTGRHPSSYIKEGKKSELKKILVEGMTQACKAFEGKPVWVRLLDAPTDEFKTLKGGENEPEEDNPMLGWRGIRRSLDEEELFLVQIEAVRDVYKDFKNLGVMIPLVTSADQLTKSKELAKKVGCDKKMAFGIMVETPGAALDIEEFLKEGVDFVSFGTNDLTQYTLAIDRNNKKVAKLYNPLHPSILFQLSYVIKACKKAKVETSICGEAGSDPEMAKFLVKEGIDSISVERDAISKIRKVVADAEKR